ncbi:hypothetical protein ECANGB1_732 [Enterospora canceri]|uniref:Uncharacterized protein n=1 Tax=Enterospora canceri TaxID=1081671 RepID=A0A1Y1S7H5_9MICR|nr:hypothetical protein ECANGB1_732 [Enterospora canceri]
MLSNFQKLVKDTQNLLEQNKQKQNDEIEFRIQSNLKALKILATKIEDDGVRNEALKTLSGLGYNETSNVNRAFRNRINSKINNKVEEIKSNIDDLVEEEMYQNSKKLQEMTNKFNQTLSYDKKALEQTLNVFDKNTKESKSATKAIIENDSFSSFGYFTSTLFILLIMWIIIGWL